MNTGLNMDKSKVAVAALHGYEDREAVAASLARVLAPLGGMKAFVHPGDRVLLKANLLAPALPEEAVTTHPEIVRAVIRAAYAAGAAVVRVGDGPGVGTTRENMRACGMEKVCMEEGAEVAEFRETAVFEREGNRIGKRLELTAHLLQTDVLITLPKLKTHVQMGFSGALKNQYGLIPGTQKAEYHFRLQDRDRLCDLMIDINRTGRVALAIMDAVYGMEGPGPHGGKPRFIGALIGSADLAAMDCVACRMIGVDPARYPLLRAAARGGYGTTDPAAIEVCGDAVDSFKVDDYRLVEMPVNVMRILPLPQWMLKWLRRQLAERPWIDRKKCIKCLKCRRGCPVTPSAINPLAPSGDCVDQRTCIRCYCCHEFCPVDAIELRRSLLERIFHLRALGALGSRILGHVAAFLKR